MSRNPFFFCVIYLFIFFLNIRKFLNNFFAATLVKKKYLNLKIKKYAREFSIKKKIRKVTISEKKNASREGLDKNF